MNNKADFAPIRWSYKKTREVARRMDGKPKRTYSKSCTEQIDSFPWRVNVSSPTLPPGITCGLQGHRHQDCEADAT